MSSAAKQRGRPVAARPGAALPAAVAKAPRGTRGADELLDALPYGVLAVSRRLRVEAANREAGRLLALPRPAVGAPLPEPWRAFSLRRFARARSRRDAAGAELRVEVDGARIVELTGMPTADGAVLLVRDVTVSAREAQAERTFLANAAHELRASLGGISSAVEALELGAKEDPAERNRLVRGIGNELRRLRRDVEALLALSRAYAAPRLLDLEPLRVAELIEQVAGSLVVRPEVEVETDCDPGVTVRAEKSLLEIALRNVARNAAAHTTAGRITLSCRRIGDARVALDVNDDGPGIPPARRDRLFERFAAADAGGSGIGLPLTREIVQLFAGQVDVGSDGGGTRVRLVLPAA